VRPAGTRSLGSVDGPLGAAPSAIVGPHGNDVAIKREVRRRLIAPTYPRPKNWQMRDHLFYERRSINKVKGVLKSICNSATDGSDARVDESPRTEWISASTPAATETPTCNGAKSARASMATVCTKHFATSRRITFPTATGRTSPDGLASAVSGAPQNQGAIICGAWPWVLGLPLASRTS
jgi:hypothetical protein